VAFSAEEIAMLDELSEPQQTFSSRIPHGRFDERFVTEAAFAGAGRQDLGPLATQNRVI
jgi:hypothetical protein